MAKNSRMKKLASEIKNNFDEFISRMDTAEERISERETEQLKLYKKRKKKERKHNICEKQISERKICLYGSPEAAKEEEMG